MPGLSVANRSRVKLDYPQGIELEAWRGLGEPFAMDNDDDGVLIDLDELLAKHGLTRPQLAEKSGVSYSHISNLANGTKTLTTKIGVKLAKALGMDLAELMGGATAPPAVSGTVDALGVVSMDKPRALIFLEATAPLDDLGPAGSLLRFVATSDWHPGTWQLVEVASLVRLVKTTPLGFVTTYGEEVARTTHHRPIGRLVEVRTYYE